MNVFETWEKKLTDDIKRLEKIWDSADSMGDSVSCKMVLDKLEIKRDALKAAQTLIKYVKENE